MTDAPQLDAEQTERARRRWLQFLRVGAQAAEAAGQYGNLPAAILAEWLQRRYERERAPLVIRAQEVADALEKTSQMLDELQAEVRARTSLIEALVSQTDEAERRSEDAIRRAQLNEEQAKAVDAYLDQALKNRISELEMRARRREWMIGTVVALTMGVVSILFSHYVLHF